MIFNRHSDIVGEHAYLSPSKHSWVNYDEDKIVSSYLKYLATQKGTELHAFAEQCIRLKIKLPKSRKTLNCFVNDAIGFRMTPEQPLYYSVNSFGTSDAICFRDNILRIHDLKTGVSPVAMSQLEIYAALFCLEYKVNPKDIDIELRLYQSDQIIVHKPEWKDIKEIMQKIISFDKILELTKTETED
jgi:hypothetical protein